MKRVLLTGFLPFGGEKMNPSQILVEQFQSHSVLVEKCILPVVYFEAFEIIRPYLLSNEFDFCLMLGQAGGRNKLNLEQRAINQIETNKLDENGQVPLTSFVSEIGPSHYQTKLNLKLVQRRLGEDFEVSQSAGFFVCNFLYYKVLEFIEIEKLKSQALFLHVPFLPEQASSNQPSMNLNLMKSGLSDLMELLNKD